MERKLWLGKVYSFCCPRYPCPAVLSIGNLVAHGFMNLHTHAKEYSLYVPDIIYPGWFCLRNALLIFLTINIQRKNEIEAQVYQIWLFFLPSFFIEEIVSILIFNSTGSDGSTPTWSSLKNLIWVDLLYFYWIQTSFSYFSLLFHQTTYQVV